MSDDHVEVSSQGWLSRIGESIKGVLVGLVLFALAFPLLWWNEGRAVQTFRSLEEGAGSVVSVSAESVEASQEGGLVHVIGLATTDEVLSDPLFGVQVQALRLQRKVEMYQWVEDIKTETKKRAGGKKETTKSYSYSKQWRTTQVDSASFKRSSDHQNPDDMPYRSESWQAREVSLGAFLLSSSLTNSISASSRVHLDESSLSADVAERFLVRGDGLYKGRDPSSPQVGDLRVGFHEVVPMDVSIIAKQLGEHLTAYQTEAGDSLELLSLGHVDASEMFAAAERKNTLMTWGLRLAGLILMTIGMGMVFSPLSVVADVIPLIGDIVGMGTGIVAFVISLPCTLTTIGLAWIFYRPVLGIALIAGSVGLVVVVKIMAARR